MNPAFSVIFLTTLIGVGQGLFVALFAAELGGFGAGGADERTLLAAGGAVALVFTALGLFASVFHLGRPERAWRAAAMWRTSWLSREVIALPLFLALVLAWSAANLLGSDWTLALGWLAALACVLLFVCTGMVYASIRFLQEWASAYTLVNFTLLGLASGFVLATALAAAAAPAAHWVPRFGWSAVVLTLAGAASRALSLRRNARLRPKSTLASAIGIRHPQIAQVSMGFMGGSFNTREFFHGRSARALRHLKWVFVATAFVLPPLLLVGALSGGPASLTTLAFALQYAGLLVERWFFLAQANHPQNLYYQVVS